VPVVLGSSDTTASFTWNPPLSGDETSYAFAFVEPTETAEADYDYAQHVQATITIPASTVPTTHKARR
jgi:hypothetical protein